MKIRCRYSERYGWQTPSCGAELQFLAFDFAIIGAGIFDFSYFSEKDDWASFKAKAFLPYREAELQKIYCCPLN